MMSEKLKFDAPSFSTVEMPANMKIQGRSRTSPRHSSFQYIPIRPNESNSTEDAGMHHCVCFIRNISSLDTELRLIRTEHVLETACQQRGQDTG
jgi:hypothetical protein